MKGNLYLDKDWLYNERVMKGRDLSDIAKQFGVSREAVSFQARKWDFRKLYNEAHKPYTDKAWLEEEYINKRRKSRDIADGCGVSAFTIRAWARRYGLRRISLTREQINAQKRERYRTDADYRGKRSIISRKWREKNLEHCRAVVKKYYLAHKGRKNENSD